MVKRVLLHLEDKEYERLLTLKNKLGKNWKDFVLFLVDYYLKSELKSEMVMKDSLVIPYKLQAKALSEIGKLLIHRDQENYEYNVDFYLASLLPLVVSGERVGDEDLMKLYVLVVNLVFNHLKDKYKEKNDMLYFLFEYLRTAVIRELRGDTPGFYRLMKEVCNKLRELGELP